MTEFTVIDANCWSQYVEEMLEGAGGVATRVYDLAQVQGAILFDGGRQIRQQYVDVKKGFGEQLFDGFFEKGFFGGTIKLIDAKADRALRQLLDGLGVPRSEHIYFRTAKSGGAEHIVSEDIDFFDPRLKARGHDEKLACKHARSGNVCKAFRKDHEIVIHCMEGYLDHCEA